ncbi:MAG: exonuclease SbcCD subunit D C-terminal domain-containing protein, partial [Gammaproteobacteria bacterium]|nr:exonuclease SbcCD subunit D C-terminal domain-containing protein [Gammaproteobacteria bacterium]
PTDPVQLVTIPNFQPMASLKGNLKDVIKQITGLKLAEDKTLWLEVTVIADEYLSDVHKRLLEVIDGKPIELLRVMRRSAVEKKNEGFEARKTLSELTVGDVFQQSLKSNLELDEEESKMLTELFQTCLVELEEHQQEGEEKQS